MSTNVEIVYPGPAGPTGPTGPQGPAGTVNATVADTPPTPVQQGHLYWESDSGNLFVWYEDGTSGQWVQISGPQGIHGVDGTSMLSGEGAPAAGLGDEGDTYFDRTTGQMWHKEGGVWVDTGENIFGTIPAEAEADADRAEAAADAAMLSGDVYPTTAAGLAATAEGGYFSVPSAESAEYLILYREVGGVATEIKRYPSTAALDFARQNDPGGAFLVADDAGKTALVVGHDGSLQTKLAQFTGNVQVSPDGSLGTAAVGAKTDTTWLFSVTDDAGHVILGVDGGGTLRANLPPTEDGGGGSGGSGGSGEGGGGGETNLDYDIAHVITYGQSLSVGQAIPPISTAQGYDNLMFYRGMIPQYGYPAETPAEWYASLVPAVEAVAPGYPTLAETPSSGTGDMIKQLLLAENGLSYGAQDYRIMLSNPGYGATIVDALDKGTVHYSRLIEQVTYAKNLANAASRVYGVGAVTWTQGESDYIGSTPAATYRSKLDSMVTDLNNDIKVITGQTKSIPMLCYQLASHKTNGHTNPYIALELLDAAEVNPLIYMATPMYQFTYADGNHLNNISSRWLGAYYGLCYKRVIIDGWDWKPLSPRSHIVQGSIINIDFDVWVPPLAFDTTQVALNTNYGFEVFQSDGTTPVAISSVVIAGPARVRIVCAGAVPPGAKVRYAWTGSGNVGSATGPRGNLRDSQGDSITFLSGGLGKRMDNWCVIFELET